MAHFFRKHDQKKKYNEIDAEFFASLSTEQTVDQDVFGYLKVQLPKSNKMLLKTRSWVTRYCYLSNSELTMSKNEFREYEKGSMQCKIQNTTSMKMFQSVKRSQKKPEKRRWKFMPPRFVEIVDDCKKRFRLSFVSDDEMNYWLSALTKAFNKTHMEPENVVQLMQNRYDGMSSEFNQPEPCEAKIKPIPAPRLSKLKLLAGAMDEAKTSNENEGYKKVMEVRADMLTDRRRELLQLLNSDELVSRIYATSEKNENSTNFKSMHSICCENQVRINHPYDNDEIEYMAQSSAVADPTDRVSTVMEPLISKKPFSAPLYPLCFTKFVKPNENVVDESIYLWSILPEHNDQSSFDSTKYAVSSEKSNYSGKFSNRNEIFSSTPDNDMKKFVSKIEVNVAEAASKNSKFIVNNELSDIEEGHKNAIANDSNGRISPWVRPKICKPKCSSCGCDHKSFKSQCSSKNRIRNRNFFNDSCNASAPSEAIGDHFSDGLAIGDVRSNLIDTRFRYQSSDFMKKMRDVYDSKSSLVKNATAANLDPWSKVRGTGQFLSYNRSTSAIPENTKCFKLPGFESAHFRSLSHITDQENQKHTIDCKLCRS